MSWEFGLPPVRVFSWATPSTIDWCEPNYTLHGSVAEFWNTVTSLAITVVGVWGMSRAPELRFQLISFLVAITGLGSVMFHATLSYFWQLSDELPMIWLTLQWIYVLFTVESPPRPAIPPTPGRGMVTRSRAAAAAAATSASSSSSLLSLLSSPKLWRKEVVLAVVLAVYALAWSAVHAAYGFVLVFQTQFIAWVFVGISRLIYLSYFTPAYRKHGILKRLLWLYFACTFASCMVWLADKHGCEWLSALPLRLPNPQCHAWWHLGQAYSLIAGGCFAAAARQIYLTRGKSPRLVWAAGIFPYVEY